MSKVTCNVIRDLLPLYADDVLSEDTKALVNEHLAFCKNCQQEFMELKTPVALPDFQTAQTQDLEIIKGLRRKFVRKKILIVLTSILLTAVTLLSSFYFLLIRGLPISADQVEITSEILGADQEISQRSWVLHARNKSGNPIATKGGNGYFPRSRPLYKWEGGEQIEYGTEYHLYQPLNTNWGGPDTFSFAWSYGKEGEVPENFDYIFRIVFKDKTVEYSARDAGLFAP